MAQRAPTAPIIRLDQPVRRTLEPLSSIVGARPLGNGALLVTDFSEVKLQRLQPNGEARVLGRSGAGPREYTAPTALIARVC